jgi:hypothetical protein
VLHGVAYRVLFSTDQGFPLAAAFAYSVYQFQSKRVKRNPEGPFFGGNAMIGALFSTLCCLAVACGVSAEHAVMGGEPARGWIVELGVSVKQFSREVILWCSMCLGCSQHKCKTSACE